MSHGFLDGYEFLMQNCAHMSHLFVLLVINSIVDKSGDRICIFGFSRGAYTARGLAGMIHKVCIQFMNGCSHHALN
jgi:uncharacterized protein (DUF2235 family)